MSHSALRREQAHALVCRHALQRCSSGRTREKAGVSVAWRSRGARPLPPARRAPAAPRQPRRPAESPARRRRARRSAALVATQRRACRPAAQPPPTQRRTPAPAVAVLKVLRAARAAPCAACAAPPQEAAVAAAASQRRKAARRRRAAHTRRCSAARAPCRSRRLVCLCRAARSALAQAPVRARSGAANDTGACSAECARLVQHDDDVQLYDPLPHDTQLRR